MSCSGSHGKAARLRDLAVLGYLGAVFDQLGGAVKSVHSVAPYRVSWSNVALSVCHEVVPRSQILYAINGNLVALCITDDTQVLVAFVAFSHFTLLHCVPYKTLSFLFL